MLRGEYNEDEKQQVMLSLKQIKNIMLTFDIDLDNLTTNAKNNLMF